MSKLNGFRGVHKAVRVTSASTLPSPLCSQLPDSEAVRAQEEPSAKAGQGLLMQMAPGFAFGSRGVTSLHKPAFQGQNIMLRNTSCISWEKVQKATVIYV